MCAAWWQHSTADQTAIDKARGVTQDEPVHVSEYTGKPCTYCTIPASDPEKAYYQCPGIPKPERERRLAARGTK